MTVIKDDEGRLIAHIAHGEQDPAIPAPDGTNTETCPHCGARLEIGYGLAGGGMGTYFYCDAHGVICKEQDDD